MKLTADANILFSALLKEGVTRKIWFDPQIELYAPKYLLTEFAKYKPALLKKFGGSKKEFESFFEKLVSQACFLEDNELKPYLPAAASLSKDQKDWLYLACALKQDTGIWSNDKEFKKQNRITTKTTTELFKEAGLK